MGRPPSIPRHNPSCPMNRISRNSAGYRTFSGIYLCNQRSPEGKDVSETPNSRAQRCEAHRIRLSTGQDCCQRAPLRRSFMPGAMVSITQLNSKSHLLAL